MAKAILAGALSLLLAAPAYAQVSTSAGGVGVGGSAVGIGGAGGVGVGGSGVGIGGSGGVGVGGAGVGNGGQAVGNRVIVNGGTSPSSSYTVHEKGLPVATAVAPPVTTYNSCAGSPQSGALSLMGVSISLGTGNAFDNACRLHMIGEDAIALAYLCRVVDGVRESARDAGRPCPVDVPSAQPVVAAAQQTAAIPDWCETLSSAAERREYAAACKLGPRTRVPRH